MWSDRILGVVRSIARLSAYLGGVALLICVAITVIDVIMRNFFASSVLGSVELTQLCVMWAAFLTIPLGFAYGNHISVDVFVERAPRPVQRVMSTVNMLIAAIVLACYLYWGGAQALHAFMTREITLTLGIPISIYWLPIIFGTSLSLLSALAATAHVVVRGTSPSAWGRDA